MIASLAAAAALLMQAVAPAAWTWTLYEGEGPLVLANEIPDTANLRATLECEPGSGGVQVTLYGVEAQGGFATIASGDAAATTEAAVRRGALKTLVRVDHPAFAGFVAGGAMTVTVGDRQTSIDIPRADRAKLRRFADRCAG